MNDRLSYWLDRSSCYIALLVAWVAMVGSLYFSEVAHYIPCTLCWYQRILMYPLALILAIGLLRRDENLPLLVLPFSVLGIGVSTYHVLLEKTDWFSGAATCQVGVPCTVIWINWFGFLTIPFLALIAFLVITVMMILAWQAGEPALPEGESPQRAWPPVLAIIAAVIVAFGLLIQFGEQPAQAEATFTVVETGAPMMQLDGTPVADGEQLYLDVCATCHGPQGEGVAGLGNALAGSTFVAVSSDDEVVTLIRTGRVATDPANQSGLVMPPSGGRPDLSDGDLLAIVKFLRTQP
jgi:disulfide bond formation protein DsbB/mono/diheme cytochrome c family protein